MYADISLNLGFRLLDLHPARLRFFWKTYLVSQLKRFTISIMIKSRDKFSKDPGTSNRMLGNKAQKTL